ncbi:transketolase [Bacillus sp. OV166]|uniref:transketolase n=1 Tax=Bacillus sp. OV166 TaxID=1882763 RepID=UPI000A2AEEFC|nr:transketolase [Bacillus sp. OV166]SMQ86993.1 transketolase [Bacillus sp. OV166]
MSILINQEKVSMLKQRASETRKLILKTVHHAGAGHVGGPMSAVEVLVSLYFEEMNINPADPYGVDRDRFVLSKGHSAIVLYSVLAQRGYFPIDELNTFDEIDSRLQGHPDMKILPGVDMSTGSLGQGISAAVGIALGGKLCNKTFRTYCMIGDGESQEGQVWEAADVASKYQLDNLVVIMDYNKLQQYGWAGTITERENPAFSAEKRWEAFGWNVISVDGHDVEQINMAFKEAKQIKGKPTIIIANTIKGKGVSFMENSYSWHARVPNDKELEAAITEIEMGV